MRLIKYLSRGPILSVCPRTDSQNKALKNLVYMATVQPSFGPETSKWFFQTKFFCEPQKADCMAEKQAESLGLGGRTRRTAASKLPHRAGWTPGAAGGLCLPSSPPAHSQARQPASPDPLMNTKEIKDDAIRWNVCFAALKSLRKMKTHTRKLYEANFTEDWTPDSKVRFCARLTAFFVTTFHLPSSNALW